MFEIIYKLYKMKEGLISNLIQNLIYVFLTTKMIFGLKYQHPEHKNSE